MSTACRRPDPKKELALSDFEGYWVVDPPERGEQYIAPAARFALRYRGQKPAYGLEAMAVFRREGDTETFGSDWRRVQATGGKPLEPGQATIVVLRSDRRYHTNGATESMFGHQEFRDVSADIFIRLGGSEWTKMGQVAAERRIGSKTVTNAS
jgi:hypothetical protein